MDPKHMAMALAVPGPEDAPEVDAKAPLRAAMTALHAAIKADDINGMMDAWDTAAMCGPGEPDGDEPAPMPEGPEAGA